MTVRSAVPPEGYLAFDLHQRLTDAGLHADAVLTSLSELYRVSDRDSADDLYWQIDNHVVVQGVPSQVAADVTLLVLWRIPYATELGLKYSLRLLLQLNSGSDSLPCGEESNPIVLACRERTRGIAEVLYGLALAEDTEIAESAVELLAYCDSDVERFVERTAALSVCVAAEPIRGTIEYWRSQRTGR